LALDRPFNWFFYWGAEHKDVPKYERGVLKRRGIKYGEKGPFFIATKRPVEEMKKPKPKKRKD